jgi:hypothetical protein
MQNRMGACQTISNAKKLRLLHCGTASRNNKMQNVTGTNKVSYTKGIQIAFIINPNWIQGKWEGSYRDRCMSNLGIRLFTKSRQARPDIAASGSGPEHLGDRISDTVYTGLHLVAPRCSAIDRGNGNKTSNHPPISDVSTILTSDILILADSSHLPSDEAYRQCLSLPCNPLSTPCYKCKPNERHFFDKIFIKACFCWGGGVYSVT